MSLLFSSDERTRTSSRRYNESMYSFLNTSGWPSVARVREFWEGWFAQYDEDKKPALAARFQSADNHNLLSAFLELFTFAVLKHAGYAVQIDPPIGTRTLDFLATADRSIFYAECTATGRRVAEAGEDAREADIVDAIDKVPTGRFLLAVQLIECGAASAPLGKLRQAVTTWLSSLDSGDTSQPSEWTWRQRGWVFQVTAMPAEGEALGGEGAVGMIGYRAFTRDQAVRLREAIDGKASKYGSLDMPLLVVTDSTEHQVESDLMTALLGDVLWHINFASKTGSVGRKPNGVLYDTSGPRNVTLSAVMHGDFDALNFADRPMILMHHPFANHPLPLGLFAFCEECRFHPETGDLESTAPATTVGGFFDLPDGWPFFDLDPRHF